MSGEEGPPDPMELAWDEGHEAGEKCGHLYGLEDALVIVDEIREFHHQKHPEGREHELFRALHQVKERLKSRVDQVRRRRMG